MSADVLINVRKQMYEHVHIRGFLREEGGGVSLGRAGKLGYAQLECSANTTFRAFVPQSRFESTELAPQPEEIEHPPLQAAIGLDRNSRYEDHTARNARG